MQSSDVVRIALVLLLIVFLLLLNTRYFYASRSFRNVQIAFRELFFAHALRTRIVMQDEFSSSPFLQSNKDWLLQNQRDIGDAFGEFYGEHAGEQVARAWTEHIVIAGKILVRLRLRESISEAYEQWEMNAKDIARLHCELNPFIDLSDMEKEMNAHLALTTAEAIEVTQQGRPGLLEYDRVQEHILHFADFMSDKLRMQKFFYFLI